MVSPWHFHLIAKSWLKTKTEFVEISYFSEPTKNILGFDSDASGKISKRHRK
jgi:hypothetical protein